VQLRQLGDILLTTPCIREIKRQSPDTHLTFLSHKMGKLVLDGNPFIDEYFVYGDDVSLVDSVRLAKRLRQRKFDLVIDFMNNPRSAFYTVASGAFERVAFRSARRFAYTDVVPRPSAAQYIVREKFLLLESAGFAPQDTSMVLPWMEAHAGPLVRCLAEHAAFREAAVRVVLSPTHRRQVRRWPLENYAALADILVARFGAFVHWIWGPGEEQEIDRVRALCQQPTTKAPATSFRELAAFIANHDFFVGNSNGPSHLAVATDICSLQLHGPTRAAAWSPLTEKHQALQSPLEKQEPDAAMAAITVAEVVKQIETQWPTVLRFAAERRQRGPKLSWRLP